jgi:quercetin dioxygenase-like cupin family protein
MSLLCGAVATVIAAAALATPSSGIFSTIVARAAFVDPVDLKLKIDFGNQEVLHVTNARDTIVQNLLFQPGGQTGWHSHWGPTVVLVKSGSLTLYDGEDPTCTGRTYTAGQAFIDRGQGHVHLGANLGSETAELWTTFFDVPPGESPRIDAPDPGTCPF